MGLFDQNKAVLEELASQGTELTLARTVDFSLVFSDEPSARSFADTVSLAGFTTKIERLEREADQWDVTASKYMIPSCENITSAEEQVGKLASQYCGNTDGWGFFGSG